MNLGSRKGSEVNVQGSFFSFSFLLPVQILRLHLFSSFLPSSPFLSSTPSLPQSSLSSRSGTTLNDLYLTHLGTPFPLPLPFLPLENWTSQRALWAVVVAPGVGKHGGASGFHFPQATTRIKPLIERLRCGWAPGKRGGWGLGIWWVGRGHCKQVDHCDMCCGVEPHRLPGTEGQPGPCWGRRPRGNNVQGKPAERLVGGSRLREILFYTERSQMEGRILGELQTDWYSSEMSE